MREHAGTHTHAHKRQLQYLNYNYCTSTTLFHPKKNISKVVVTKLKLRSSLLH